MQQENSYQKKSTEEEKERAVEKRKHKQQRKKVLSRKHRNTLTEKEELELLRLREEERRIIDSRRKDTWYNQVVFVSKKKVPVEFYQSSAQYGFLQYLFPVIAWGRQKLEISEKNLYMLLYVYPIGPFNNYQLELMSRILFRGDEEKVWRNQLEHKGLIKVWRKAKEGQEALYCLTHKTRTVIAAMHNMMLGKTPIPNFYVSTVKKRNFKKLLEDMSKSFGNYI